MQKIYSFKVCFYCTGFAIGWLNNAIQQQGCTKKTLWMNKVLKHLTRSVVQPSERQTFLFITGDHQAPPWKPSNITALQTNHGGPSGAYLKALSNISALQATSCRQTRASRKSDVSLPINGTNNFVKKGKQKQKLYPYTQVNRVLILVKSTVIILYLSFSD